jgi:cytochrome oxidase Cu insertion factor (SCO1/SenC/PrrC family)
VFERFDIRKGALMGKRKLAKAPSKKDQRQVKSNWTTWAWLGGLGVVVAAVVAFLVFQTGGGGTAVEPLVHAGSRAPDFTLPLLNGQTLTLASLKGKPILMNFWAST